MRAGSPFAPRRLFAVSRRDPSANARGSARFRIVTNRGLAGGRNRQAQRRETEERSQHRTLGSLDAAFQISAVNDLRSLR